MMLMAYLLCLLTPEKRRYQAIYYTLIGKRTTSNLYAGLAYGLLKWLQIYPNLEQTQFQVELKRLQTGGLVEIDARYVWLTTAGRQKKAEWQPQLFWPTHYMGPQMGHLAQFTARFLLAIQIVSEYQHQNTQYYPLATSMKDRVWVASWFKRHKSVPNFSTQLQTELTQLLAQLDTKQADLLVNQFIGHHILGKSQQQLAWALDSSPLTIRVRTLDAFAQILGLLLTSELGYPLLTELVEHHGSQLSQSTLQTWQLIQHGATIEQISQQRHVKVGTIKEHLLEAAILLPQFPFTQFLIPGITQKLAVMMAEKPTLSFNEAQAALPQLDFFVYRLYQIQRQVSTG
ncbi:helix-turn-helix domain-containing protein [Latilactobacillus graminis]|uniref:Helicase Helix-turn-helix domain-containing protein n=2 Tax=Latilactobacillus graminis TaxID=60519 RepID=A0AA89I171_9LACO|nr:helix-turn-helix domain-containing protein [Latilactobacillus graminis]KRM23789.1 hypothetical protein FC90_GL001309 [Latilactobacillus graminis DSM 20719]QFP79681.1 hypothetical protein LG542_05260 [Latilactobacillus graminis]